VKALYIAGPTAVGKTSIALQVATRCNGEIIGADAFQVYDGLDVLTAKPSAKERRQVPHHLIGTVPLSQSFDVAQYLEAAKHYAKEVTARGKLPIFTGGTGLYIRALTHGLSDLPKADAAIRAELDSASLEDLQARYTALDPEGATFIDLKNKRRLVRAIEVCLLTGKPFSSFRDEWKAIPESITGYYLTRDRDDLYARINERVHAMFHQGVVEEVRTTLATHDLSPTASSPFRPQPSALSPQISPTAAQAIGFKEIQALIAGEISEAECIARVQQATRRYAKRQETWFRKEAALFREINLSTQPDTESVIQLILSSIL